MRLIFGEAFREGIVERSPVFSLGKFIGGAPRRKEKVDPFSLEDLAQGRSENRRKIFCVLRVRFV